MRWSIRIFWCWRLRSADEPLQEKSYLGVCRSGPLLISLDEMEALGPVRLTEVQGAQSINVARRLSDEGTIVLAGRGGDDLV